MRRVVVTGMGVISPLGNDLEEFTKNLKSGFCGLRPIVSFDASSYPFKTAFEVMGCDGRSQGTHLMDPFIRYAVAATDEAFGNAGLRVEQVDPYRIGISVSSSKGGVHTIDRFQERFQKHPSAMLGARIYANTVPNFGAQWIARKWELKGPAKCYIAACATGTVAVIEGARMVADGVVDYCIAGASDASITPLMMAGYYNMKALAHEQMLPFDKRRSGFMVGEGAGVVLLESLENAQSRGVPIYGEIAGHAYGTDGKDVLRFSESEHALSHTIQLFLKRAGWNVADIDYINLHGTGTVSGDLYETREIKHALGKQAYQIPMSSTKSMTGHMLGASGTVEIIASLLAMKDDFLPPTIGLDHPDPECDLDYVPKKSRNKKINRVLSLSMGFGGHIAVIGLQKL
ncbi:MAG: beta-ketoacyl-[acyl-carrier-protein] synthase family protein [Candidatus Omnitrophica bacterium]|nr:beta-ketoacyl-[acyl-carrier-protein] synthase family protein [Candidatus Omnitrophota bacterium]